jgi:hypothetical protein
MFNIFNTKNLKEEAKEVYSMPEKETNKPSQVCYSIGMTDDDRVSLHIGYSNVTMNAAGVTNMIQQLELFRDQIQYNDKKESAAE